MIGAAIGSLLGGVLADKYGRKPTIISADIIFTVGAVVMAVSPTIPILVIGRFIIGIGVGLAAMVVPVYLSEISPLHLRGRIVTINTLMIVFGQFCSTLICL
jgi:MFS family permease